MSFQREYAHYDGLALAELIQSKAIKPIEAITEAIRRLEKYNPSLNAVIQKTYDLALDAMQEVDLNQPLAGVPFLLKDLVASQAGVPLRNGSRFFQEYVPPIDSELVKRFKQVGLVSLGKSNTPEFGLVPITEPLLFGPTHNPWNLEHSPGGSSGGSAAAVAARIVPLAHASDGGGSIRIPASCCGLFGLKPSRGLVPTGPNLTEIWQGLAGEHVVSRSVRDSAAVLSAIAGPDVGPHYYLDKPQTPYLQAVQTPPRKLRIAFSTEAQLGQHVHPDCVTAVQETAKGLQDLGHEVEEAQPYIEKDIFIQCFVAILCGETWATIQSAGQLLGRKPTAKDFEPATWALYLLGERVTAGEFARAAYYLKGTSRILGQFFENYDILLTPTLAQPPVRLGELQITSTEQVLLKVVSSLRAGGVLKRVGALEASIEKVFSYIPFTPLFNATGQPAMSVPLYWNEQNLPIGLQFVAPYGDELTLFSLAGQLEQAYPWADKMPDLVDA